MNAAPTMITGFMHNARTYQALMCGIDISTNIKLRAYCMVVLFENSFCFNFVNLRKKLSFVSYPLLPFKLPPSPLIKIPLTLYKQDSFFFGIRNKELPRSMSTQSRSFGFPRLPTVLADFPSIVFFKIFL